jgi:hypothetical protein
MTAVAAFFSWQAYRAEKEAVAVAKLRELRVDVVYLTRRPQWLYSRCGERMGRTVVSADAVTFENCDAAIPHLKMLPNLKEICYIVWPPDSSLARDAGKFHEQMLQFTEKKDPIEAMLRREMPHVTVTRTVVVS